MAVLQVWDLDEGHCVRTLDHDGSPVQQLEIAGTRLHSVAGCTVGAPHASPSQSISTHLKCAVSSSSYRPQLSLPAPCLSMTTVSSQVLTLSLSSLSLASLGVLAALKP